MLRRPVTARMNRAAGIGGDFGFGSGGGHGWSAAGGVTNSLVRGLCVANGRSALSILAACARMKLSPGRATILLPAYLCHTVIQPFDGALFQFRFYDIECDLSTTASSVMDKYDRDVVAVILMNYFGHSTVESGVYAAIREAGDALIFDDRSHSLLTDMLKGPSAYLNSIFRIYSVRKWGPFPDLALLVTPKGSDIRPDKGIDYKFFLYRFAGLALRGAYFNFPAPLLSDASLRCFNRAEILLDARIQPKNSSYFSRLLWKRWDWRSAAERRRENFAFLSSNWTCKYATPLFSSVGEDVCPMSFPIVVKGRAKLRQWLIDGKVYCPIHWPQPRETRGVAARNASNFYAQELTIPIDQRYAQVDMSRILQRIDEFRGW